MSRSRKNDLKSALRELKVNEPLRLPSKGPQFQAPQTEGPHSVPIRNELPQIDVAPMQVPQNERSQNKESLKKAPRKEHARFEGPNTSNEHAPKEAPHSDVTQTEMASEIVGTEENMRGYFKLSHAIFSDRILRELPGDCFRLFLWMSSRAWRFPTSEGILRASVNFVTEQTGMSHATVSRALKALKETELVSLIKTDFKRGNVWKVFPIAYGGQDPQNCPLILSRLKLRNLKRRKKAPQYEREVISI